MNADRSDIEQAPTRRELLARVAAHYTEEIYERRTAVQLVGPDPVARFAAITSDGSIDSSRAADGNLIVAETMAELAERLRQEAGEGWLAHGRVWDLDAPFHIWGNLEVAYLVRVGDEVSRLLQVVRVAGREDHVYFFDDPVGADAFCEVIRHRGGVAELAEQPVHDARAADRLIDAEDRR